MDDNAVSRAMKEMDDGYLAQDYYRRAKNMVELENGKEETFTYDNYSWTEHMSRKWGQWLKSPKSILDQLAKRGFKIEELSSDSEADDE